MAETTQNHYQVLGVERTADERAIKKAYFGLVRKFPPDTHADEFKRIREAYEVLSDPIARKRFDDADHSFSEYEGDVAAALREADEAAKTGDEAAVQAALAPLVEAHPELQIAREKLAASYTRANDNERALQHLFALVNLAPETARYHFHAGLTLRRLDRLDEAHRALAKAHELEPSEVRFHVGLVDVLIHKKQLAAAKAELDEAIAARDPASEDGLGLALRKIDLLFVAKEPTEARREVTRFLEVVRGSSDPEMPKYAATQLAGLAAALFFRKEIEHANALLGWSRELHPESPVHRPYPITATIDVAALPDDGRAWLARQTPSPTSPVIARPIWGGPVLAFLGAVAVALISMAVLGDTTEPWGAGGFFGVAVLIVATVSAFAYAIRSILRIATSPLRAFTTLHPLYLIQASADKLTLYPLFNLSNVSATHHHTNGVYSHTLINLSFGAKIVGVRLTGQEYAEGWLGYLVECRSRSLELMMEGYLEAEQGIDVIPPALLDTHDARAARERKDVRRWGLGAAAVALGLWVAAIPWHARKLDDVRWRAAVRGDSVVSYAGYLAAAPDGRHAEDAKREQDRRYEAAAAALRAAADPSAPGARVLADMIAVLRKNHTMQVPVRVELDHPPKTGSGALAEAWTSPNAMKRADELVTQLNEVLTNAGIGAAMHLERSADDKATTAILIRCKPRLDGGVLEADTGMSLPSFAIEWTAQITVEGVRRPELDLTITTATPAEVRAGPLEKDVWIYARLSEQMVASFTSQLAEALGLKSTIAALHHAKGPAPAAERALSSPYAR